MNVVMPVEPAIETAETAASVSATERECRLYMLHQKLIGLAATHGTSLPDVVRFASTVKNSKYTARARYVADQADTVAATAREALKRTLKIGGKQYKRLAKHNFIIKPNGKGKYHVGKRIIKLKSTLLVTACRHLHAPRNATLDELVGAFQTVSNVAVSALRSNSACESTGEDVVAR